MPQRQYGNFDGLNPFCDAFSSATPPTHAALSALPRAHAYWMLSAAYNPMLCRFTTLGLTAQYYHQDAIVRSPQMSTTLVRPGF